MIRLALLLLLAGCTPKTVLIDDPHAVEIPVPVEAERPAALVKDCPGAPLVGTTLADLVQHQFATDAALAQCRCQLALLRNEKGSPLCPSP